MKLRAYLIDDEPLALDRLERLLAKTDRVEVAARFTDPLEALDALNADPPDVCFLDIQMPGMNGFELLAKLPRQPVVIFTTAYDQYALRAFEVNSIDYLLKPVDPQQLDRALTKIENLRAAPPDLRSIVEELAASLRRPQPEYPDRIASRLGDRLAFIDLARVTHFYAQDKLTYAVADGKSYSIDHTITELEKKLDPRKFTRIHRATLLNTWWVKEIATLPGGGLNVRLKDAATTNLTVARDRARELKEKLGW